MISHHFTPHHITSYHIMYHICRYGGGGDCEDGGGRRRLGEDDGGQTAGVFHTAAGAFPSYTCDVAKSTPHGAVAVIYFTLYVVIFWDQFEYDTNNIVTS